MSSTPGGGREKAGTPRTLVNAMMRALSTLAPVGIMNSQSQEDPNLDPDFKPDAPGEEDQVFTQRQMNEFRALGSASENVQAAHSFYERMNSQERPLEENRVRGETSHENDLTSGQGQTNPGNRNENFLGDRDLSSFGVELQRDKGESSSSGVYGGREIPSYSFLPPSRDLMDRSTVAPVLSGGKAIYDFPPYPQHHLPSFREENDLPLTSSNFTMDIGRY